jgi:hypothetical protein
MKKFVLSKGQFAFVVATRAALGVGIGLLAAGRLCKSDRRRLGAALVGFGALTTIPALYFLFGARAEGLEERSSAA